ncbi:MAG: DUF2905 domain-containing protein [Bdellovibrionia bacterium]
MTELGKSLILLGLVIVLPGLFLVYQDKLPFVKFLGKLPGDMKFERENFTFYFPLATSIVVSVLFTLLFALFNRK